MSGTTTASRPQFRIASILSSSSINDRALTRCGGARNQLTEAGHAAAAAQEFHAEAIEAARLDSHAYVERAIAADVGQGAAHASVPLDRLSLGQVRQELLAIRETLLA